MRPAAFRWPGGFSSRARISAARLFYLLSAELIGVRTQTLALIQLRNLTQLLFIQAEIPDVKVFSDARRRDGFRDHHQTAVEMPADDDLRRRFAVLIGELVDDFLIEDAFAALGQRAPGFGLDLVGGVPRVQLTLLHKWMVLSD